MIDTQSVSLFDGFGPVIDPLPDSIGVGKMGFFRSVTLPTWEPDHLHWNGPSGLVFHDDGRMYFFAKRLSNQRRTGLLDSGRAFYATVELMFSKTRDDPQPFYTYEFAVVRLDWKTRVDDYKKTWHFPGLLPYFANSSVGLRRHWRADSNETPPVVIPFPSIGF